MYQSLFAFIERFGRFQFDSIELWLTHMEQAMEREAKELKERWDRATEGMTENEKHEYADWNCDEPCYVTEVFPRLFWQSAFVTIWSCFEQELIGMCHNDMSHEAETFEEGERKTKKCRTLKDVKDYLNKTRGVKVLPTWDELNQIREVRNQVVHNGGRRYNRGGLPLDEKESHAARQSRKVDQYVRSREVAGRHGLSFENGCLVVGPEFCRELVTVTRELFLDALKKIPTSDEGTRAWKKIEAATKKSRVPLDLDPRRA